MALQKASLPQRNRLLLLQRLSGRQVQRESPVAGPRSKLYGATMTNYDEIFEHVTPPIYRGYLEMKILDHTL